MTIRQDSPALVVGGGIGGLAAALALARIGWPSLVVERRAGWSEAGAGIQISPNGVRVLSGLGVSARLQPKAGRPREIVVRRASDARVLQRLPLGDWIAERQGAPYWQVHRRDLQMALVEAVTEEPLITVVHGFEADAISEATDGVQIIARDGRSLSGSLLVGADGVFSRVRPQLHAAPEPRFSGRTAARTVLAAPSEADRAAILRPDATGVWLAPGAHIVHYPVRGGREIAIVVVRTEAWKGQGWSEPVAADEIERAVSSVAPAFAEALGTGQAWRRWALFELDPLPRWSTGRATLLGDAAHPTLPFMAQGGVLALEDAATLAACLSGVSAPSEIPRALGAYDGARRERSRRVVATARRNGVVFHLSGAAAFARDAAMGVLSGERVMAGYDWIYGWKPPLPA